MVDVIVLDRSWYQDLNCSILLWLRCILLSNQICWGFISLGVTNDKLAIFSYCTSVIPSLLFIITENAVLFIQPDSHRFSLHKREWTVYRLGSVFVALVLLCAWLGTHETWLTVVGWGLIAMVLIAESSVTCYNNNYFGEQ